MWTQIFLAKSRHANHYTTLCQFLILWLSAATPLLIMLLSYLHLKHGCSQQPTLLVLARYWHCDTVFLYPEKGSIKTFITWDASAISSNEWLLLIWVRMWMNGTLHSVLPSEVICCPLSLRKYLPLVKWRPFALLPSFWKETTSFFMLLVSEHSSFHFHFQSWKSHGDESGQPL